MPQYILMRGKVFLALKDATTGKPKTVKFLGNAPEVKIGFTVDNLEHRESFSCNNALDAIVERSHDGVVSLTLEELLEPVFRQAFRSSKVTNTGAAVTNEILTPTSGVVVNDEFITVFQDISAITVKDSAGSPATLVLNTDYSVSSAKFGRIKILNLGAFVLPFKIDYTYATRTVYPFFNLTAQDETFLHVEFCNTAESNKPYCLQLYRCQFPPVADLGLITNEWGQIQLSGAMLADTNYDADANFRQFGRLIPLTP